MSNQEVFDAYAEKVAEQNSQIRAAVTVILQEIGRLQGDSLATNEKPLDTAKMEQALQQLTASVDEVEAIHPPVEEVAPAPVEEVAVEEVAPVEEVAVEEVAPVEEVAVEEVAPVKAEVVEFVEDATTVAADKDSDKE